MVFRLFCPVRKLSRAVIPAVFTLLAAESFAAQPMSDWQFEFTPYTWATDLETTAGSSRSSATSTIDFDDLLSITDAAWMSMLEARRGNWSIMNDVVYMKISEGATLRSDLNFVSGANLAAVFEQETIFLAAGYTPDESATTFFGGLRYNRIDAKADANIFTSLPVGALAGSSSRDEDWFDPVVGVRHVFPLATDWTATVQADIGGGIDSEFSTVDTFTINYSVSDLLKLSGGYRYARIDKDDDDVLFDQTAKGLFIGFGLRF